MSTEKVYNIEDKIFAKVRGYCPWPAKIIGVKSDTPSRLKYEVLFYGTNESAICKPEDIFSFEENKAKLGRKKKSKKFNEAIILINNDNGDLDDSEEPGTESDVQRNIDEPNCSKVVTPCICLPESNERKRKIIDIEPEASSKRQKAQESKSFGSSKINEVKTEAAKTEPVNFGASTSKSSDQNCQTIGNIEVVN